MFFFGHIGISTRIINRLEPKADLRWVAGLSILPDLIDKPIGIIFSQYFGSNTRLFGHSLVFALIFLLLLWQKRNAFLSKKAPFWPYALALFSHDLLDRIWEKNLECFLWPLLGPFKPLNKAILERWLENILKPYNFFGELIGMFLVFQLFRRYQLYKKEKLTKFISSGELVLSLQNRAKHRGR